MGGFNEVSMLGCHMLVEGQEVYFPHYSVNTLNCLQEVKFCFHSVPVITEGTAGHLRQDVRNEYSDPLSMLSYCLADRLKCILEGWDIPVCDRALQVQYDRITSYSDPFCSES